MSLERLAAPGAGHNHASHIPRKAGYHCFVCRIEGPGARALVTISPGTFYQRGSWKASWLWCSTIFTLAKVAEVTKAEKTVAWDVVCKPFTKSTTCCPREQDIWMPLAILAASSVPGGEPIGSGQVNLSHPVSAVCLAITKPCCSPSRDRDKPLYLEG